MRPPKSKKTVSWCKTRIKFILTAQTNKCCQVTRRIMMASLQTKSTTILIIYRMNRLFSSSRMPKISKHLRRKDSKQLTPTATQSNHCLKKSKSSCSRFFSIEWCNSSISNNSCYSSSRWLEGNLRSCQRLHRMRSMMGSISATFLPRVWARLRQTLLTWLLVTKSPDRSQTTPRLQGATTQASQFLPAKTYQSSLTKGSSSKRSSSQPWWKNTSLSRRSKSRRE